jgi:uncharacterized repeat protein (TIGR03803 family)
MTIPKTCRLIAATIGSFVAASMCICPTFAYGQTETIIHTFQSKSPNDGYGPVSGLVADSHGSLYGTTQFGGGDRGTVYRLSPPATEGGAWTETLLHTFRSSANGLLGGTEPSGAILMDSSAHKIFGTTRYGGGPAEGGVVYELKSGKPWTETVLYNFKGAPEWTLAKFRCGFRSPRYAIRHHARWRRKQQGHYLSIISSHSGRRFMERTHPLQFYRRRRRHNSIGANPGQCRFALWHNGNFGHYFVFNWQWDCIQTIPALEWQGILDSHHSVYLYGRVGWRKSRRRACL